MARGITATPGVKIKAALKKLGSTPEALAIAIGSTTAAVNDVISGGEISPEASVKLGKALGEKPEYFAGLQLALKIAAAKKKAGKVKPIRKAPAKKPGRKPASAGAPKKPGRKPGKPAAAKTGAPKAAGGKRGRPKTAK